MFFERRLDFGIMRLRYMVWNIRSFGNIFELGIDLKKWEEVSFKFFKYIFLNEYFLFIDWEDYFI